MLYAVVFGSEWTYFAIFFGICLFSMVEFYRLLGVDGQFPLKTYGTVNGLLGFTLTFLIEKGALSDKYYLLIFISLSTGYLIILYEKKGLKPFINIAVTFLGIMYVALPYALLNLAAFYVSVSDESGEYRYQYEVIMGALFLLWASDSGAYFAGKAFGRRKLFERVSPKKTWEGVIGGALLAAFIAVLLARGYNTIEDWKWYCIAFIIVVGGTYGDLVESLFKRSIQIKDSGRAIPGHGGFLDRFDGLLFAAPFIVALVRLF